MDGDTARLPALRLRAGTACPLGLGLTQVTSNPGWGGHAFLIDPEMISLPHSDVGSMMRSLSSSGERCGFSYPIYTRSRMIYLYYRGN